MAKFKLANRTDVSTAEIQEVIKLYESTKKLNLGCGRDIREGYFNVDLRDDISGLDLCADIRAINFLPKNMATELLLYDVVEHFPFAVVPKLLAFWVSLVAPEGKVIVRVPDLEKIATKLIDGTLPIFEAQRLIYGGQEFNLNFHCAGFTGDYLEGQIIGAGCREVIQVVHEEDSHNVVVVARK